MVKDTGFRLVLENMKNMTWRQRIAYLWEYYKWLLIGGVVVLWILGMLIGELADPDPKYAFMGAQINVRITDEGRQYLTEDLFPVMGVTDPEEQTVELLDRQLPAMEDNPQYAQTEVMAMVAMVSAQMLDYALMDEIAYNQYRSNGMFNNLETLLTQQQLSQFDGKLLTTSTDEDGEYFAIIDITDTAFARDCLSGSQRYYLAFPGNTGREEKLPVFVDWILAWGK